MLTLTGVPQIVSALLLATQPLAHANTNPVELRSDATLGRIEFLTQKKDSQGGSLLDYPILGRFLDFNATIRLPGEVDLANGHFTRRALSEGEVEAQIACASVNTEQSAQWMSDNAFGVHHRAVETGWKFRDHHIQKKDFLDCRTHPTLSFRSDNIQLLDSQHFVARGQLILRGKEIATDLPFTLSQSLAAGEKIPSVEIEGETLIHLSDFEIGGKFVYRPEEDQSNSSWSFTQMTDYLFRSVRAPKRVYNALTIRMKARFVPTQHPEDAP